LGQFLAMLFCQLGRAHSLREICGGLACCEGQLKHLGVPVAPKRSTLAYANENRPWELCQTVFEQTLFKFQELVHCQCGRKKLRFKNKLMSLDGSIIDLSVRMFDWAKYRQTKGAIKLHLLLDHDGYLPSFAVVAECNRQALVWRDQIAHQRPWPGDDSRTVEQVFAEEQPRLLPHPMHPLSTDLIVPVRSVKTIYVRFDLNDYSIPPEAVGRPLTLVASDTMVRILEGTAEIACHHRSYDRHQEILEPAHQQALLKAKRKAFDATPGGASPRPCRRATPFWTWLSLRENPPAAKPPNS
jgi:hypothetical protein